MAFASLERTLMSTPERAQAYRRVIEQLDDLAASKLHADEQAVVREAADSLLFSDDLHADPAAERALLELYALTDRMVDAERISLQRAGQLVRDVEACGPAVSA
jgi:hypothetical protein